LMNMAIGRLADSLIAEDGTRVACVSPVERTLKSLSGMKQMQIIQLDTNRFDLNLARVTEFSKSVEERLLHEMHHVFEYQAKFHVHHHDNMAQGCVGKSLLAIYKPDRVYC